MPSKTKEITLREYYDQFNDEVRKNALRQAYEIRKFEIELYWKRATYFWTFIGAAFVAFAAFVGGGLDDKSPSADRSSVLLVIACIGLVFSVAWHCVNKGSKFWQENWENHVELLEDSHLGPLYKTFSARPEQKFSFVGLVIDPEPFSVSKINQLVSCYIALTWAILLYWVAQPITFDGKEIDWEKTVPVSLALATCLSFWAIGKSHHGGHSPKMFKRTTEVAGTMIVS